MVKKILIGLAVVFAAIQFFRPEKNLSGDVTADISTKYTTPDSVKAILQRACNDCHSNKTVYPWYDEIQPVNWWITNHVNEGKWHLNFNNFAGMRAAMQKKKMEECIEQVKKDEMPLSTYTFIHTNAKLSEDDKQVLYQWCNSIIDTLKATYPADSLVLPKRKWD